eukprot:3036381-Ditylum_brightwellii.AAC.1
MTTTANNYLPPKSEDDTHLENIFAEELKNLSEEEKLAFLAKKQTVVGCHLREIKQRANDSIQSIFAEAIIKQNILHNSKAITNLMQYKKYTRHFLSHAFTMEE